VRGWRGWLVGAVVLLPSLILAAGGAVYLQNGLAVNAAFPVPLNMSPLIQTRMMSKDSTAPMPRAAYVDAANILRRANSRDGNAELSLAEARLYAGEKPRRIFSQVEDGLMGAPTSAEGWTFYAEILAPSDPKKAARALDQAFTLAPYDFFLAERRVQLASHIWNYLGSDTKSETLRQTRRLWDESVLRDEILSLLATSDGGKLLTRAYADDPDTLRTINRWVSARRRQLQSQKS